MDKFADSIGSFFSGGDQIPWCDRDIIVGCEREVAEAKKNGSDELKNESIMRLSWALVHSKQSEDVQRGIARLEVDPDTARISEVKAWVASQLEAAGKEAPEFEYTPLSVGHLYNLASVSQAKTQAANIIAADFRQKAAEYRSQAARIREILENVGLAQESLASNVVSSTRVLANVANLLNIRDTELSSFLVAMGDLSLRKTAVEEKRAKVEKESKILLDYTRKAIARLTYLKSIHKQLEDDVAPCQKQMEDWKTSLVVMASKERQYMQQYNNYKALLNRVGYTPEISHGVLVEMAECRKELEKKTKPILDTLRSYQDLPPDKALAALAIEDKKRQYAAAEKYLEDVLHSALATND